MDYLSSERKYKVVDKIKEYPYVIGSGLFRRVEVSKQEAEEIMDSIAILEENNKKQ